MKKTILTIVAALTMCLGAQAENPYKKFTEKLPFSMPEVTAPVIPNNQVKLTDFGAVGDGITLNTEAFAKAIDALSQKGGGKLVVPQGVWHTGPTVLKSNIELNLKAGAVILTETDKTPREVLLLTQQIERDLGRKEKSVTSHLSPLTSHLYKDRPIDIDILLYDDITIDEPDLKIPHPLMKERDFVMIPLREIMNYEL